MRVVNGIKMMLLVVLSVYLVACGGGSSGGGGTTADTTKTTIKTTLDMTGTRSKVQAKSATNINVSLYLESGESVQMTENSDGSFSADVEYTVGTPIYIVATVDNITLRNYFSEVTSSGSTADLGSTSPSTTLLVDVIEKAVGATITTALSNSAVLSTVDVESLRTEVATGSSYQNLRNTYATSLTWDNTQATTVSAILATTLNTFISENGLSVLANETMNNTAEETVYQYMTAYMTGDIDTLNDLIYSNKFMNDGLNSTEFAALSQANAPASGEAIHYVSKSTTTEIMLSSDSAYSNLSGLGLPLYRVFTNYHYQVLNGNNIVAEYANNRKSSQETARVMQKIDGKWYMLGDQDKARFGFRYYYDYSGANDAVNVFACQNGSIAVSDVKIRSDVFEGAKTLYENTGHCWDGKITQDSSLLTYGANEAITLTSADFCGKNFYVDVTYADNTTQTKKYTIPACVEKTVSIDSVNQNTDGTVTVNYTVPANSSPKNIILSVNGIYSKDGLPFNSTSKTITANFVAGTIYTVQISFEDLYSRRYSDSTTFQYN